MVQQRNTRQRQLVLNIVKEHCDHPTADQIFFEAHEQDPKISRGTVYRNLNILVQNGAVRQIDMPSANRFDSYLEPHYHIECCRCGCIVDAPIKYQEELDRELEEKTGFTVERHNMVFSGYCSECR